MLHQFIDGLDEDDRMVFMMRLDRCPYHEIAEATGLDEGTLRVQVFRLIHQFFECAGK